MEIPKDCTLHSKEQVLVYMNNECYRNVINLNDCKFQACPYWLSNFKATWSKELKEDIEKIHGIIR